MSSVRFGSTVNGGDFEYNDQIYHDQRWDEARWQLSSNGQSLRVKSGIRLSEAVSKLFSEPSVWSVDCAEFTQLLHWYATLCTYGPNELDRVAGTGTIRLRTQESSGITTDQVYSRSSASEPLRRAGGGSAAAAVAYDEDQLLAQAPVGTIVAWTNAGAPVRSAFRNENAVKVGPNQYAAHGFDGKYLFTRMELELELARAEDADADPEYVVSNIFVSRIVLVHTVGAPTSIGSAGSSGVGPSAASTGSGDSKLNR